MSEDNPKSEGESKAPKNWKGDKKKWNTNGFAQNPENAKKGGRPKGRKDRKTIFKK